MKELKIIPVHIGIIMDGNGRWAEKRNLPRIAGHQEGIEAVRRTVQSAVKYNIKYLTLYSFSTENWKRPKEEIEFLFSLMEKNLIKEGENLHKNNIRVRFSGRRWELPSKLIEAMEYVENLTKNNTGLNLIFAINYGGRAEIIDGIKEIIKSGYRSEEINEELMSKFLYLPDVPEPDLIIRTSGEKRISNFLLWQSAYSEFYFTPVLWPDFDEKEFLKALFDYQKRKRKFGGVIYKK
ncbi:MAG: isoprenyl transferase [Candidatus Omnitrophica bacterium]|nr:isoprenyl transferase [Candidatus Omnitrophota bacterium]MCM8807115.1 isoprenyl transferase [Candidatus Omnitrophota bacterium]